MPDLDTPTAGNGPKRTAMWLDGEPYMVTGLDAWPKVGDRLEIDGKLWRVVEVSDRFVLEREPSQPPADTATESATGSKA